MLGHEGDTLYITLKAAVTLLWRTLWFSGSPYNVTQSPCIYHSVRQNNQRTPEQCDHGFSAKPAMVT